MTLRHLRRWYRAVLLFLALFCLSVIIQFAVGWYQRRATAQDQLRHWATEVTKDLVYTDRWNLTRFRQSFPDAGHYYVVDRSGLIIDIEGVLPEFPIKVDLTHQVPGIHSVSVSQTNESWRLLVSRVDGGFLFLGVSPPEDITNVDQRLHKASKRFGSSLREALRVKDNEIDKNIDYAIVADDGSIENAAGGIPLEAVRTPAIAPNKIVDIRTSGGATFGALLVPIESTSRRPVGDVLVFGQIPPQSMVRASNLAHECIVIGFVGVNRNPNKYPLSGGTLSTRQTPSDSAHDRRVRSGGIQGITSVGPAARSPPQRLGVDCGPGRSGHA